MFFFFSCTIIYFSYSALETLQTLNLDSILSDQLNTDLSNYIAYNANAQNVTFSNVHNILQNLTKFNRTEVQF